MADASVRDGRAWRIGTDADVAWIAEGTSAGLTITAAIPPVFEAYATILLPGVDDDQSVARRSDLLTAWARPFRRSIVEVGTLSGG